MCVKLVRVVPPFDNLFLGSSLHSEVYRWVACGFSKKKLDDGRLIAMGLKAPDDPIALSIRKSWFGYEKRKLDCSICIRIRRDFVVGTWKVFGSNANNMVSKRNIIPYGVKLTGAPLDFPTVSHFNAGTEMLLHTKTEVLIVYIVADSMLSKTEKKTSQQNVETRNGTKSPFLTLNDTSINFGWFSVLAFTSKNGSSI